MAALLEVENLGVRFTRIEDGWESSGNRHRLALDFDPLTCHYGSIPTEV